MRARIVAVSLRRDEASSRLSETATMTEPCKVIQSGLELRARSHARPLRRLPTISEPLWPPKPKLLDMPTSIFRWRGRLGV